MRQCLEPLALPRNMNTCARKSTEEAPRSSGLAVSAHLHQHQQTSLRGASRHANLPNRLLPDKKASFTIFNLPLF